MASSNIKQDINFLENPLWFQDSHKAESTEVGFVWQDKEGFVYRSGYKPPVKIDMIFLLYLLLQSQKDDWEKVIEVSRYEILQACTVGTNTYWYNRLEESLKRWKMVGIEFEGTFYDGKEYKFMNFGIVDSWEIRKDSKKLQVVFSSKWLNKIKQSNYFKMIDFAQIKELRAPLATRLHEILLKSFQSRLEWSIGAKKLAAKIPMKEKYAAHIIPKIKTAVNRINEKTDLQIHLTVRRPERGKAIFDFEKLVIQPVAQEAKEQGKKTLRELITRKLRKEGSEFVRRNILYANKHAKSNYRVYLTKAFKEDWGEAYEEDTQEAQATKQARQAAEEEKRHLEEKQEHLEQQARETLLAMTPEEKQALEDEARVKLEATNPAMLRGSFASAALKIQMNALLLERLRASAEATP